MKRNDFLNEIEQRLANYPIVAILGPRQCGKTTLARSYWRAHDGTEANYFDLEKAVDLARLETPFLALEKLSGLVVIDEIQRVKELFPALRVLVDREDNPAKFLVLGSASRDLIQQASESLAGRISYLELTPFSLEEDTEPAKLWLRGGFPLSYLAKDDTVSYQWREDYISTFLEQDIPNLGIKIPATTLRQFWSMLAHYHGNIFNASEMGRTFGVSHTTIRDYLNILTGTFMVRQLQPWHENLKKRQVKAPKIYLRDSGLLHSLLRIEDSLELERHNKLGNSWEGFALEEIIRFHKKKSHDCYFWATHSGAELDLLIDGKERLGFEFKYSDAPKLTKSMLIACEDLKLNNLTVLYPGKVDYALNDIITVKGLVNYIRG